MSEPCYETDFTINMTLVVKFHRLSLFSTHLLFGLTGTRLSWIVCFEDFIEFLECAIWESLISILLTGNARVQGYV